MLFFATSPGKISQGCHPHRHPCRKRIPSSFKRGLTLRRIYSDQALPQVTIKGLVCATRVVAILPFCRLLFDQSRSRRPGDTPNAVGRGSLLTANNESTSVTSTICQSSRSLQHVNDLRSIFFRLGSTHARKYYNYAEGVPPCSHRDPTSTMATFPSATLQLHMDNTLGAYYVGTLEGSCRFVAEY